MVLCRVYMNYNIFIYDEVMMPSGWKNMIDEKAKIYFYRPKVFVYIFDFFNN